MKPSQKRTYPSPRISAFAKDWYGKFYLRRQSDPILKAFLPCPLQLIGHRTPGDPLETQTTALERQKNAQNERLTYARERLKRDRPLVRGEQPNPNPVSRADKSCEKNPLGGGLLEKPQALAVTKQTPLLTNAFGFL